MAAENSEGAHDITLEPVTTDTNIPVTDIVVDAEHWALPGLAKKINDAIATAEASATAAMNHALIAGRLLIEAKEHVPHGGWGNWLATNCTAAARTCQAYMRLAKKLGELPNQKRNAVAYLPLRQAMRAIATTDPAAPRRQCMVRAERRDDADRDTLVSGTHREMERRKVAPVAEPATNLRQAQRPRAKRIVEMRSLVQGGHNVEQIAEAQGVSVEYVRLLLKEANIKVPGQKLGRAFKATLNKARQMTSAG